MLAVELWISVAALVALRIELPDKPVDDRYRGGARLGTNLVAVEKCRVIHNSRRDAPLVLHRLAHRSTALFRNVHRYSLSVCSSRWIW